MDVYGRLLCYLNRDQPDADDPEPRPKSYNERLLALGSVAPYFIWPNLDPYRPPKRPVDAVPVPNTVAPADVTLEELESLDAARESVRQARQQGLGIFDPDEPAAGLPIRASLPVAAHAARAVGDRPERRRRPAPEPAGATT